MNIGIGFFMSKESLNTLREKSRKLSTMPLRHHGNVALTGSMVTVMDCADSQVYKFRLVETAGTSACRHHDLPIGSALGIALLGCRAENYINLSLGGEESGTVVLCVDNNNL